MIDATTPSMGCGPARFMEAFGWNCRCGVAEACESLGCMVRYITVPSLLALAVAEA